MKRSSDVVSASEIASWVYCPEAWRLGDGLKAPSANEAALSEGKGRHTELALFEERSSVALSLGWWLLAAAVLILAALAVFLGWGR